MKQKKNEYRKKANQLIRKYWLQMKNEVNRDPVKKKKVPTFTRHNSSMYLKLSHKEAWRARKGLHSNRICSPKIGYKNPEDVRFRKKNGLDLIVVYNLKEILMQNKYRKDHQVFTIARTVGARKRQQILQKCSKEKIPLYITK